MASIDERATQHHMYAFVAIDTIEAIIARIEPMLRSGRRMTLMRRYVGDTDNAPDLRTGLHLEKDAWDGGVQIRRQDNPKGSYITAVLTHVSTFSVGAWESDGTEEQVRVRYQGKEQERRDCARIEILGGFHGMGKEDRIILTRFGEYGVGEQIVLAFDMIESHEVAEAEAANLDAMAATGRTFAPEDLTEIAEALRWHWRPLLKHLKGQ